MAAFLARYAQEFDIIVEQAEDEIAAINMALGAWYAGARGMEDKPGIDVIIKPGTKGESVHIPVILTLEGLKDVVYNTSDIGEGADVLIVAGCGIHNPGEKKAQHDGYTTLLCAKVHDCVM